MTHEELDKILEDGSYLCGRLLEDGTAVVMIRLIYTTAIAMGVDQIGWMRRYCFDDPQLAHSEYLKLRTLHDEPQGWIARR